MDIGEDDFFSFLNQCTETWMCPSCKEKGISAEVKLFQANCQQAVYFCVTPDCLYPQVDDKEPVIVNRTLLELPVDGPTLNKFGLPANLLDVGSLTYKQMYELRLIHDAITQFDEWNRLEKEMVKLQMMLTQESECNPDLTKVKFNSKCTPLNILRTIPNELMNYAKHFIPNVEEVVELLKLDIL